MTKERRDLHGEAAQFLIELGRFRVNGDLFKLD